MSKETAKLIEARKNRVARRIPFLGIPVTVAYGRVWHLVSTATMGLTVQRVADEVMR